MEQEQGIKSAIKRILEEASVNVVEERVLQYIIRELHQGRSIEAVLNDPYVRNRLNESEIEELLENEKVLRAVQEELNKAFKDWDFKFSD
jgi:predicted RNA binding protein with dsRBD fold (UPF0201 family)